MEHPLRINNVTLKHFAMISVVSRLYEQKEVKEKIKEIINEFKFRELPVIDIYFPAIPIKSVITDIVKKNLSALKMPKALEKEAQDYVICLGDEVIRWVNYVTISLELDVSYIDHICWTCYGRIDDSQTFTQFWQHDASFSQLTKGRLLYSLACIYADEELILKSMNEMTVKSKNFYIPVKVLTEDQMINIIGVWIINYSKGGLGKNLLYKHKRRRKEKHRVKDLFRLCVQESYVKAAKYFFEILKENEKPTEIMLAAEICIQNATAYMEDTCEARNKLEQSKTAELLIWLLNKMTTEQKHSFLLEYIYDAMPLLLFVWPYQEIVLQILSEEQLMRAKYEDMFLSVMHCSLYAFCVCTDQGNKIYLEILERMLKSATTEVKKNVFLQVGYPNIVLLADFFHFLGIDNRCIDVLNLIINDSDLQSCRNKLIAQGDRKIQELIEEGNIEALAIFIKQVLNSNNERRNFIKKWKLLNNLLKADDSDMANYILNCVSNCEGEDVDVTLHLDLDHKDIHDKFIEKGRNDLADKYVKWYMIEEERRFRRLLEAPK